MSHGCTGKVRYATEREAKGAAAAAAHGCRWYFCEVCRSWHTGHATRIDKLRYGRRGFIDPETWEQVEKELKK